MHSLNKVLQTHIYLLNALDKLNRKGIIHFDIKYDNIVYDQTLQAPIIIDFGLSIYKPNLSPANYAKEFIEHKATATKFSATKAGLLSMMAVYSKKIDMVKSKELDKLINLQEVNLLDDYIKDKFK